MLPRIMRMLAQLSADRVPVDARVLEVPREALLASAERRARTAHRLVTRSRPTAGNDGGPAEMRLAAITTERDAAMRERDEAFALAEGYEQDLLAANSREQEYLAQNETLRSEVLTLRENFDAVVRYTDDEDATGSDDDSGVPEHVETWSELAEHLPSLDGLASGSRIGLWIAPAVPAAIPTRTGCGKRCGTWIAWGGPTTTGAGRSVTSQALSWKQLKSR